MGTVEYKRRIYEYETEEGKKGYIFLLDEYLKMDTVGKISSNLIEKIIDNVTNLSYRKSADNINKNTNQDISHTTAWNIVQKIGEKIEEKEEREIKLNKEGKLNGNKEVNILFEEMDGIWLNMQGKDRKSKKRRKRELKLGVFYEGWEKKHEKKDRYLTINKKAYASFEGSKKFKNIREAKIASTYNQDEIEVRIINGDGAKWIKEVADIEGAYFQLDPFHKSQAIVRSIEDKESRKELIEMLKEGKVKESLDLVTKLMIENTEDDKKLEKLEKLYNYLVENKNGLIPYNLRDDIKLPKPPEGILYRNLGTMEHNVCDIAAQRMKNMKGSWSVKGASNLAKILSSKNSKELYSLIDSLLINTIEEEKFKEMVEVVELTAAQVNKKPKKSTIYPTRKGETPFSKCAKTNGRTAIRKMIEDRCATELKLKF